MNRLPVQMSEAPALSLPIAGPEAAQMPMPDAAATLEARTRWASGPLAARLAVIRRFRHALVRHGISLAQTCAAAKGRPVAEVMTSEVLPLADACRFLERQAPRLLRPVRPAGSRPFWLAPHRIRIHREPHGLILVLGPSNYPLFLPGVQALQALTAGNAVWLKPGAGGSAPAHAIAWLLREAGLDAPLLSILPESPQAARSAIARGVDKVVLTGSSDTGRAVLAQLAPHLIPATMELSGSDPMIVRHDADLELVTRSLRFGIMLNGGATCIAPRRVLVSSLLAPALEARLADSFADTPPVPIRDPHPPGLAEALDEALSEGARLLAGGHHPRTGLRGPIVLAGAPRHARILREAWFAPLTVLVAIENDEDALTLAASSPMALGASVFSRDIPAAALLARRLPGGVVTLNDVIAPTADPRLPFGGSGQSGFGRTRGAEGLLEMTRTKAVIRPRSGSRPHLEPGHPDDPALFKALLQCLHGSRWRERLRASVRLLRAGMARRATSSQPSTPPPSP